MNINDHLCIQLILFRRLTSNRSYVSSKTKASYQIKWIANILFELSRTIFVQIFFVFSKRKSQDKNLKHPWKNKRRKMEYETRRIRESVFVMQQEGNIIYRIVSILPSWSSDVTSFFFRNKGELSNCICNIMKYKGYWSKNNPLIRDYQDIAADIRICYHIERLI